MNEKLNWFPEVIEAGPTIDSGILTAEGVVIPNSSAEGPKADSCAVPCMPDSAASTAPVSSQE